MNYTLKHEKVALFHRAADGKQRVVHPQKWVLFRDGALYYFDTKAEALAFVEWCER